MILRQLMNGAIAKNNTTIKNTISIVTSLCICCDKIANLHNLITTSLEHA